MKTSYDVIVIGVGAMGSAACFHAASRGARVLGLEQFSIPHTQGSAHGESRMIRLCYYEHPDYVPLLKRAYTLWDALEEESGEKLLHMTGGIYIGSPDSEFITGTRVAAEKHQLPHEFVDQDELCSRFSMFNVPEDYVAIYEPNAGILRPEKIVEKHTQLAVRNGAEILTDAEVLTWNSQGGGVSVRTKDAVYSANRLIICAGAWSEQFLGDLDVPLTVTRQIMGWVQPRHPEKFQLGKFPVWAVANPGGSLHYGFPILSNERGLKVAHHIQGESTTVETINRTPQPGDDQDFLPTLQRVLPDATGPLQSMAICMYTNTPDSHFVIDRHLKSDRVIIACGFSGHGFKFASVVGEILADLALDNKTDHPIDFLGLHRFNVRSS